MLFAWGWTGFGQTGTGRLGAGLEQGVDSPSQVAFPTPKPQRGLLVGSKRAQETKF